MATRYRPPREYVESHAFQLEFDAVAKRYPDLVELVGALLWGIGENPFDFDYVPGHESKGLRVAKTDPVLIEEGSTELMTLRIYFVVPESGPIDVQYLDVEAVDAAEMGS
jgi:hypothetical protein